MGGLDQYSEAEVLSGLMVAVSSPGWFLFAAFGRGTVYSYDFWKEFVNIPAVKAIKIAPFNRYFSQDVVRAVCSCPGDDIALYNGNDDNIVVDSTPFRFNIDGKLVGKRLEAF